MTDVLVGQTPHGVVRIEGERAVRLDTGGATLGEIIARGDAAQLGSMPATGEVDLAEQSWMAPVRATGKVVIIGLNYADHAAETGAKAPDNPRFFVAAASAITGPTDDVVIPKAAAEHVDYEGELVVVIGSTASCVEPGDAWRYVAGVTAGNDVSARDLQLGWHPVTPDGNLGVGKSLPTFKPMGPAMLLTNGEPLDRAFSVVTRVDGEVVQSGTTASFIFDIPTVVSTVSQFLRLDPGDVIFTGTPAGVGWPHGRYLHAGQVVEVTIEGIGTLTNTMVSA